MELPTIELKGHTLPASGIRISSDGKLLATTGADQTLRIWTTGDWRVARVIESDNPLTRAIAFSPDGSLVAAAGADRVFIFSVATGQRVHEWFLANEGWSVGLLEFSPDGSHVGGVSWADSDDASRIFLRGMRTGQLAFEVELPELVVTTWFGAAGELWMETLADNDDRAYRMRGPSSHTAKIEIDLTHVSAGGVPRSDPTRQYLALGDACYGSDVQVLSLSRGEILYTWQVGCDCAPVIAFSPDGRYLAVGPGMHNTGEAPLSLLRTSTGERVWEAQVEGAVEQLLFSPRGGLLAEVGGGASPVRFRSVPDGSLLAEAVAHHRGAVFSPDGRWFASANVAVRVTDLRQLLSAG